MGGKGHFTEVFRWTRDTEADLISSIAAGVAMAAPLALAMRYGHAAAGFILAFGAMSTASQPLRTRLSEQIRLLPMALAPIVIAGLAALVISGHGVLTDVFMVIVIGVASVAGGHSPRLAVATASLLPYLLIVTGIARNVPYHFALVLLIFMGAVWGVVLRIIIGVVTRRLSATATIPTGKSDRSVQSRRSFGGYPFNSVERWEYPARLCTCLAIASVLSSIWPDHHLNWISMTVVLLMRRQLEVVPVRVTQRALGTLIGVIIVVILSPNSESGWAIVVGVLILGALRALLKERNYLAYSVIMTPLILLVLDGGHHAGTPVLIDRVIATLAGSILVVAANFITCRVLSTLRRPIEVTENR
jgi:hypothetical protein